MGLRGAQEPLPRWFSQDIWKDKRLYYSIREISIGGQCVCNGHAESCRHNVASGHPECECQHRTCGPNCDRCCPLYNQRRWAVGTNRDARQCLPCNCHGHAASCHYDEDVDRAGLSMDANGNYQGGGVCDKCTSFTTGINCELCLPGYYRPAGILPDHPLPCLECQCSTYGSATSCVSLGDNAGTCECKTGYAGERCNKCAEGFGGYPDCQPCPCDSKGSKVAERCEGDCECKENVEGKYCDRCKPGYFGLSSVLDVGCLSCYCSGITTLCESAIVKPQKIQSLKDWLITDLQVSKISRPNWNGQSVFSLGNYEFPGVKSLYWLAPEDYLGNKLHAYNSNFMFKVQWVVMRGDTSGEPTMGPNIILVGKNGLMIAFGDDIYTSSKMSFNIKLNEVEWYILPEELKDITRLDSSAYHTKSVTRQEFLSVLTDVEHILLRSTFHTDQIEALLEEASLNFGEEEYGYGSVEKCSCPSGYTGLSCELCAFGYVRIYTNSSSPGQQSFCAKCDCNGHSKTCDADTGECFCQHDTVGEKCERCSPGFYGNPLRGTPEDCKRCACPLVEDENNFSPSCQLDYFVEREEDEGSYVCTQCPKGFTGDHCEVCDDGYFGNPMEIGNSCQPCDCNGGPCDRKTGQCLSCKGNTEGWKCEKCKPEHYGEPSLSNCKACECDSIGSISKQCDNTTGQCQCKEKFIGRTCDKCEVGFGNVTALCPPCSCNSMGSKSEICDAHTGTCECQPGVEGFHCDACQNLHFGFSAEGCQPCNCDPDGAQFTMCNVSTGTCVCKPYYTGKTCDKCMDGFWKNNNKDCIKCACTRNGSKANTICDKESGKCDCKDGVTGQNCDACLPDHYGNIESGCKKCDPCDKKGHICDPNNGKCVCPPLTRGIHCQECVANAWGYEPGIGCKDCNCSRAGSSKAQCDGTHGRCTCKQGYEGEKCNRCSFGYFNYPICQKCSCAVKGTREDQCQNGLCACGPDGSCKCKENVEGTTCDQCKAKTYGLTKDNAKGCTNCFCFGRSDRCGDAHFNWDKIRLEKLHVDSNEIAEDILMLPSRFLGDLTTSYGGYISVSVNGGYFQAYLQGHGVKLHTKGNNEIQVVETSGWKIESYNDDFPKACREMLSRDCFMVVLQNVTMFTVEAKNGINEVLLDKAKSGIPSYPVTHSIEQCECPTEYAGLSCQDPNEGYYRYFPDEPSDNWIELVVGRAKICECHGRSRHCDPVSGHCKHCGQHTTGDHCERCDVGYYKDQSGNCAPCLCPTAEHNNAESCSPTKDSFVCKCKQGYTGRFCDQCSIGFYDNDTSPNGMNCIPCRCNLYGVVNNLSLCDTYGKCTCKDGFRGNKCNECVKDREYIKDGLCTPCDECTQLLFDEIDKLGKAIEDTFNLFKDGISPPWKILTETMSKHSMLSDKFEKRQTKAQTLLENAKIDEVEVRINDMEDRIERNEEIAEKQINIMDETASKSSYLLEDADKLNKKLLGIVKTLNGFGTKHVDLKEALYKAQTILDEMRYISGRYDSRKDKHALEFCSNVSRRVDEIYKTPPTIPHEILEQLTIKLNDLVNVTSFVEGKSRLAEEKNLRNSELLVKVKAKIEKLKSKKQNLTGNVNDIVSKIEGINEVMEKLEIVYEDLKKISDFPELRTLEKREEEAGEELMELFEQALDHVQQLEEKINSYRSIFNFTKDEWQKINASGAYEAIVLGIKKAKDLLKSSQDTLEKATNIIEPVNSDGLVIKANLAYTYSDRLEQRINNIKDISKNLSQIKNKLDTLKYSILQNGKSNNDLTQILHKMELEITSHADRVAKLEKAIENSTQVSEQMRDLLKKVDDMHFQKEYLFFKQYQNFLNLTNADEINILKTKLSATRRTLQNLNITSTNLDTLQHFNNLNKNKNLQSIHDKIRGLQNKINYAKQAADMVNVAMNLNNCRMSYNSPKPEFFESLSVTFKCKNCKLFKWSNKMKEVLALKVENYRPILTVENKDIFINNTENRERTVNVERTGSLMKIRLDDVEKTKKVTFDDIIDPDDVLQVGSIDKISDGYIFKVLLNENNFGLWKFAHTEGNCIGQKRDTLEKPADYVNTYFNGEGYRVYGRNNLVPTKLTLSFYFNTFDENSLIYLAKDDVCAFIALYIKDGLVYFHVEHNNGAFNHQKSDRKYNDGRRYQVTITMKYDNKAKLQHYNLVVTNTNKEQSTQKVDKKSLHQSNVFKIKLADHYIGGVPPTFNASCVTVNTTSFLGFLDQSSQLTNEKISFGVTKLNKKVLEFSHAWINRNGHIRLNITKEKLNSLSFILRPDQPNGVVLKLNELQYLYLSGYKLHLSDVNLTQNFVLNKNDYNSVQLILDRHKTLTVNGVKGDITLQGKVKTDVVQIGDTMDGFSGGIREITINNKIVSLNWSTVSEVSNADIGREKPPIRRNKVNIKSLTMTNFTNSMQNTEGCSSFGSYVTDPDAVKYGDKPNSYTHVKTNFWRNDYKLQFDFRTLYTNGVIFVSLNQKNQHYILLEVKEGKLHLSVNGKRRREPIFFNKTINDGRWHGVQFVKKKRKLTVIIDNEQRKPFRIPKNRLNDEIYLGGVPFDSEYLNTKDLRDKLLPFRGCLRSLNINDENKVLIKKNQDISHSNIRQCFPNIEEGAYFGGDAYAVYKADFRISKILELSFEFRTGEQNGILLSVSNHRNTPSLSVQLQNGGVVMAVDAGNGVVTNVTNNLDSEFALCNNRWHNVTAMYSAWELTVNVDGIRKSWVQSDIGSIMDEVEEPLYIGGVPDNAPLGTLKTRENFKGCMRKLKIDDKLMDWSDMQDLNNVMLNSCPVDNNPDENLETTNYRLIS